MCSSTPDAPAPVPTVPEAAQAPQMDGTGAPAGTADAKRRRAATGRSARSTILTSARGTTDSANTATKTLLGS